MITDHYETLGVPRDASPDDIRRAYRRKAADNHPDHGGDSDDFKPIARAYSVLSDQSARQHYDRTGRDRRHDPESEIHGMLAPLIAQAFAKAANDPVRYIRSELRKAHREASQARQQAQNNFEQLRRRLQRFTAAQPHDCEATCFVTAAVDNLIRDHQHVAQQADDHIDRIKRCEAFIAALNENPCADPGQWVATMSFSGGTSTSSW